MCAQLPGWGATVHVAGRGGGMGDVEVDNKCWSVRGRYYRVSVDMIMTVGPEGDDALYRVC
jgi:hypothetical protein